jgi:hypothetical protein
LEALEEGENDKPIALVGLRDEVMENIPNGPLLNQLLGPAHERKRHARLLNPGKFGGEEWQLVARENHTSTNPLEETGDNRRIQIETGCNPYRLAGTVPNQDGNHHFGETLSHHSIVRERSIPFGGELSFHGPVALGLYDRNEEVADKPVLFLIT